MDEYDRGMDPEVKLYFRKIISSFFWGLLWLLVIASAGIFFKLGHIADGIEWYNIVFYLVSIISLFFLLRHLYRLWSTK